MTTTRDAALEAALTAISDLHGKSGHEFARLHPALNAELDKMPQNRWYEVLADRADAALSTPATEPQGYVVGVEAVNDMAKILMDAWAKAEPNHGVTKHPTSYVATFADMARAALAARPAPQPAAWAWDADGFLQPAAGIRGW